MFNRRYKCACNTRYYTSNPQQPTTNNPTTPLPRPPTSVHWPPAIVPDVLIG